MAAEPQFTIGARASCTDGHCGQVRRLIINPATETVTHLVIQPGHSKQAGRLVPAHLAGAADDEIRLRCTRAEFDKLDHAEERQLEDDAGDHVGDVGLFSGGFAYNVSGDALANVGGQFMDIGHIPGHRRMFVEDVIPAGEDQAGPGDRVHAVDGEIGRIRGFLVNPGDDHVTHVLLKEGHMWGRKNVAIPITAVTGVDAGIRLNLTKEQVGQLPPVT